ncbi:hypothetical protein [Streptosporangium subroseum]|uniref:hypothetical protein n=1 Tax=Streptosporangium subroseum TaxID=106412 RepID=UPI0030858F8A|nr:hypothetical protein OHB15_14115 [Streptosporangium subroseum]
MLFEPTVMQLLGVDGTTYTLSEEYSTESSIMLRRGAKGLDAPTYNVMADEYPAIDGGFVRYARATIREIFLPVTIYGTSRHEMLALKRRFIASLNPKKGLVQLQSTEHTPLSGDELVAEPVRSITCFYASGMEGGEGDDNGHHWATYGIVLRATHPYFQHLTRTQDTFVNPASGGVLALDNTGDEETQPRWEIVGPLNSRISMLRTDGAGTILDEMRFDAAFTLAEGEVLVIETAKGVQSIRRYPEVNPDGIYDPAEGDSMWFAFDVASPMWAVQPGLNHLELLIDMPSDMSSEELAAWVAANQPEITVSFLPSFLGI